ncbi:6-pyruvoyltetrahydropterin/6-carboxytetrahydropterin synthase [Allochromatium warmingii]|uniref:6-carboxy-5,6,7,8-tetrahydropterin synthase n=1 Tax=Allochromatium warmingii TaxID=61595 RepID=A0A1H3DBN5_ALLWA|nr:6-carboxytetrahydropterin synthase [Allochromatium warmingii]SDX63548.1 6-pyruvoyltetrahydropterin/6-carboxytetrahydropterin synthase [Allochromatium warmingii]
MNTHLFYLAAVPFEAARQVASLPDGHRGRRRHGHGFVARVRAALPADWASFAGAETDALREALAACIAPLDYQDLNTLLPIPTDENLARWVRERLAVPGIASIGIQSTRDQGADLDGQEQIHLWRRFRFESAHRLPNVPAGHPCGRMHGHGFEVIVHANQDVAGQDMGLDCDRLAALWAPLHEALHQICLNDIAGLENPTSELLARWIWTRLKPELAALSWVTVYETATAGCHFDGQHYRIWKEQHFEAALRLAHAPEGDTRRRLHGHSYLLRLHLTAPLDQVLGWTVDYGDVKRLFQPLYKRLDHHPLDALDGLTSADPASLTRWIRERIGAELPELDRIDLHPTPGCGAALCWGELGPALPT